MGGGDNVVVGGVGADSIVAGAGNDTIAGDNAQIGYWAGTAQVQVATTLDVVDQPTWIDVIVTGDGTNVVLAGMGADYVNDPAVSGPVVGGTGNDFVAGDNGTFTWDIAGNPVSFTSINAGVTDFVPGAGAANPLAGVDVGTLGAPAFADLDGDGDLDAVLGSSDGTLVYYENTGSALAPVYVASALNPFAGIDVGVQSMPAFADGASGMTTAVG